MLQFALNHMTAPAYALDRFALLADQVGCTGVELRNDLATDPLAGCGGVEVHRIFADQGLTIHALAEVKAFNNLTEDGFADALRLMDQAVEYGAASVVLIPQMGGTVADGALRDALVRLTPELAARGLVGLVEPLGFTASTLRHKGDVVAVLDALEITETVKIVHDTFHHFLAGGPVFAAHTGMVHISGVADAEVQSADMTDAHRGLVDARDRLGNVTQINALRHDGYSGPISFEAFAPDVHRLDDPKAALLRSIGFIEAACTAEAA